jgi:hypothetical protein
MDWRSIIEYLYMQNNALQNHMPCSMLATNLVVIIKAINNT